MMDKVYPMMGIFAIAFVLLMLWDIESRMNSRFRRSDQRFNRMAKTLVAIREDISNARLPSEREFQHEEKHVIQRFQPEREEFQHEEKHVIQRFQPEREEFQHEERHAIQRIQHESDVAKVPRNRIAPFISPTTFDRRSKNNTNIFWRYAEPEYIYRVLGKVDVRGLRKVVKSIPEAVWQEGAERAKRYKVHQYTATIALVFGGDRMRDLKKADNPYEGTIPTYELFNQFGELDFKHAEYKRAVQPILEYIQSKFDNPRGVWLRVLLVRLQAGKSVDIHRDNGLWMRISHRIHIPIFTDSQVEFHASNKPKGFKGNALKETDVLLPVQEPGAVVELNNANIHYVHNSSPNDRVHMICDYIAGMPEDMTYEEWRCLMGDMKKCTQNS